MQRWQSASSVISRRPCPLESLRVSEGIAASLRHFHASMAVGANNEPSKEKMPLTRRQVSARAGADIAKIVSSQPPQQKPSPSQSGSAPPQSSMTIRGTFRGRGRGAGGQAARTGGARGGAGAGVGRGRGRGGRGRGRGGRSRPLDNLDEELDNEPEDDREVDMQLANYYIEDAHAMEVMEAHDIYFRNDREQEEYTGLMEVVEMAHQARDLARKERDEAKIRGNQDEQAQAAEKMAVVDTAVADALDSLEQAHDSIYPFHEPQVIDPVKFTKGMAGLAPVGSIGPGGMVEETLRQMANRQGDLWEEPKKLAKKLIDGEVVKFRHVYERKLVERIARSMEGKGNGKNRVTFAPLESAAQGNLVRAIVSGQRQIPGESKYAATRLETASRILSNNGSYGAASRNLVLETLQGMLPNNAPTGKQKQEKARN